MASEFASGSQTTSGTTEHTLNTTSPETTDGAFQLAVDLSTMVNGDEVILRIKEKARSSDTQRLVWSSTYKHAQAEPLAFSPPLILLHGWDMTLQKAVGSNTAFPWSIRQA